MARAVLGCEPIHKTAVELGIVTSLQIQRSNDQQEIRQGVPPTPKATGFAVVDHTSRVPLAGTDAVDNYRRFLASALPRAFAISSDGRHWAWQAGTFDAMDKALERCTERSRLTRKLYAVDDDVVWVPQ